MRSPMKFKKAVGNVYEFSQEVAVASLFLSLKDPDNDPGVWWISSSTGDRLGLRLCWWL